MRGMPDEGKPRPLALWPRRRWRARPRLGTYAIAAVAAGVIGVVAAGFGASLYEAFGGDGKVVTIKGSCEPGTSCHLISWGFFAFVPIAAAIVYLLYRLERVRRKYRAYAHDHADQLLDTELLSPVIVGREDLCEVLQKDLESRWETGDAAGANGAEEARPPLRWLRRLRHHLRRPECRRPIVLVGGVGTGKTAVLARLTQRLADRRAVPIPIRLRAAQDDEALDLLELARKKFMSVAEVVSDAEGDKIWRRLRDNDQVVIVADGLEEALVSVTDTRETAIRAAFEKIRRQNVALIVSSRPHAALKHLDAATVKLEPLEVGAAIQYITGDDGSGNGNGRPRDRARLTEIVRCAELAEMPLFMHIALELYEAEDGLKEVDARGVDRLGMRVRLIDRWMKMLAAGKIRPAAPVKPQRRAEVIQQLERLAAFGLMHDSLEVTFKDFTDPRHAGMGSHGVAPDGHQAKEILETTTQQLRAVAADGERLGLVDSRSEGVLFRHSVMQAYLGSRRISEVLASERGESGRVEKLFDQLERNLSRPGRELLMALAMSCAAQGERGRTRAIRLLLRNVAAEDGVEKEKSVYTAAAVVAAASASTDRLPSALGRDGAGLAVSGHTRRAMFRAQVILWLTRAEGDDAATVAEKARESVDDTRRAREAAEARVASAELELDDRKSARDLLAGTRADDADGRLAVMRREAADAAVVRAEAEFRNARVARAEARSRHAAAHAEAAVAATILAEKKLAEAQAQPDEPGTAALRQLAAESLERAIEDVSQSRCERKRAADAEAEAYVETETRLPLASASAEAVGAEPIRVSRLTEQMVEDAVTAEELLAEAARARRDAREELVEEARDRLAAVIAAARGATALRRVLTAVCEPAEDVDERIRIVRQQARLIEGQLRAGEGDPALRTEVEIALHAVVGVTDARRELAESRFEPASKALAGVARAIEAAGDRHWTAFLAATRPAGLAAAKAIHAKHALAAAEDEPERGSGRLTRAVIETLAAVSGQVEEASLDSASDGRPPGVRRATSRTKVLAPLTGKLSVSPEDTAEGLQTAKLDAIARLYDAAQFVWLWKVCKAEPDHHVRMTAARRLGDGGLAVFEHVVDDLQLIAETAAETADPHGAAATETLGGIGVQPDCAYELMGWLLPLLFTSIERDPARSAIGDAHRDLLEGWIGMGPKISVRSDVALAEGMRFAANERDLPPAQESFLAARVEDLVGGTKFWFTKIVLLQALTLWLLSHAGRDGPGGKELEDRISKCCKHADHPLVKAAIELCVTALRGAQPANYIWIDERAATAKLGASEAAIRATGSDERHWIPPLAGWLSLAPRAQQLLAEVVVYMNILDRGDGRRRIKELLERNYPAGEEGEPERTAERSLPLCMSVRGGRDLLDVGRELDDPVEAGARCDRARCAMRLCPYPGLGEDLSRGELSEAFCRRQYELVTRRRKKRPEWQRDVAFDELRRFWRAMERRPAPS